ncbi:MAG: GNAT family N-acetyltransferase [Selenomonadaceae bacterium]|nr:GNAT family N-acetyltransferase [Selenomonadaceae bacterium]
MNVTIRRATVDDLIEVAEIEAESFPSSEADSLEMISFRLRVEPEMFLVAELDDRLVGFINALPTNVERLTNEFYTAAPAVDQNAVGVAAMSLDVRSNYRRRGIAAQLMNALIDRARLEHKLFVSLVCKDEKIPYYQRFGFNDVGVSNVTLGGARWHDMIMKF